MERSHYFIHHFLKIAEFENSLRPHQKTNEAGENIVTNVSNWE